MAASISAVSRHAPPPLLDPLHQRGLTSLLSRTYGKPVQLNLIPIKKPHQDADILAQFVIQRLRDRKAVPRKVIRDAAWKADLPSALALTRKHQALQVRKIEEAKSPMTLQSLTHGGVGTVTDALKGLALSQVSSVRVLVGGRLSKRITANQAESKLALRGASKKGPAHLLKGFEKANSATALRAGKRRIGAYGARITLGYS